MYDARTRTGSNVSNPFFQKAKGFFTLPCREWFSVHPPYGVWRGHLIQYIGKSSTFLIVHKRSIARAQLAMALRAFPSFPCNEAFWLLQDFSEARIKVFHGLERPPKTRLEKNSQRHGPGTLSVRVFEPSTEVRVSGKTLFQH